MSYKKLMNIPPGQPIEVSTDAELEASVVKGNVGKCFKFIGTSSTYETGDIYQVLAEVITYSITTNLSNATADSSNPSIIVSERTATLKFTANQGYILPESVAVDNAAFIWDRAAGTLIIYNPTDNVSITINGELLTHIVLDKFMIPSLTVGLVETGV